MLSFDHRGCRKPRCTPTAPLNANPPCFRSPASPRRSFLSSLLALCCGGVVDVFSLLLLVCCVVAPPTTPPMFSSLSCVASSSLLLLLLLLPPLPEFRRSTLKLRGFRHRPPVLLHASLAGVFVVCFSSLLQVSRVLQWFQVGIMEHHFKGRSSHVLRVQLC
ncbi:hypothetical protein BVRB_5g106540 [Beta vulgaris subsp. vulgaris]|nr:hypothetical protein BVRB_5g106540 [Beta vulgaris subsp. vulgaris]